MGEQLEKHRATRSIGLHGQKRENRSFRAAWRASSMGRILSSPNGGAGRVNGTPGINPCPALAFVTLITKEILGR